MKLLTYVQRLEYNRGTEDEPIIVDESRQEQIGPFEDSRLDEQMEEALKYAYNGEVSVEDVGPDPEPEPEPHTLDERVSSLETTKADQTDVDELNEALDMILTGYAGEEATDAEGTAG